MEITERIREELERQSVPERDVIRHWLENELDQEEDPPDVEAIESERELLAALVERKPIAASIFRTQAIDWCELELSKEELTDLRVVKGPPDEDWRAVAYDNMVATAAFRIFETEDLAELDRMLPKDIEEVVELAKQVTASGPPERLIVVKERSSELPYIADGNHTAAAQILNLLTGGEYPGQEAYVGIREGILD